MENLSEIKEEILRRKNSQQKTEGFASAVIDPQVNMVAPVTAPSDFTNVLDSAKIKAVQDASVNDPKFIKDFTKQIKESAKKSAQVEQEKQKYEEQNVQYAQEKLGTQQKVNEWERKSRRRQYHYDGVKPIMEFVGIKTPMNLLFLYLFAIILIAPFLASKLFKGTFGVLLAGAETDNRPKAVKGFLYTLLAVIITGAVVLGAYLILGWLSII